MRVTLNWDDEAQTVVRWDCTGFIGIVEFMRYANDTAGMAMLSDSGKAHSLICIPFFTFPFPEGPFKNVAQMILANQSYGLGIVVVAVSNPFTRLFLRWKLSDEALKGVLYLASSMGAARAMLAEYTAKTNHA